MIYNPDPSTIHPLWSDTNTGGSFPGVYNPNAPDLTPAGEFNYLVIFGCPPGLRFPYLLQGGLNTERGNAATAAAFTELTRRGYANAGSLRAQTVLVVAEWPVSGLPAWPEFAQATPPPVHRPPAPPPAQPPSPPPVAPPPAGSGLHPLSPAAQRVEELRGELLHVYSDVISGWPSRLSSSLAAILAATFDGIAINNWPRIKLFAVEALRLYRRLRAKLGDAREIPAEDR